MSFSTKRRVRVALVGCPNVGKSVIFNKLTGSRSWVGNWPGTTVEKRVGIARVGGYELEVYDLPGLYSLTSYTIDQEIARNFITEERPDVIVNVVSAVDLERSLYLTISLLEYGVRPIVVVNMIDVADKRGLRVDCRRLEEVLGVPVVPMVAPKGHGISELRRCLIGALRSGSAPRGSKMIIKYDGDVEAEIERIRSLVEADRELASIYSSRWIAIKLLEDDPYVNKIVRRSKLYSEIVREARLSRERLSKVFGNLDEYFIRRRYERVREIVKDVTVVVKRAPSRLLDVVDNVLTHRVAGMLIAIFTVFGAYQLLFSASHPLIQLIEYGLESLRSAIAGSSLPSVVSSLLADGILLGVGIMLTLTPTLFMFFIIMSALEDTGYLSRVAFVLSGPLSKLKISGASVIPITLGFGCCVPAIMSTRALDDVKERAALVLALPLTLCSARLPTYLVIASALFGSIAGLVIGCLYALSLALVLLTAFMFREVLFRGPSASFMIELPPYMRPHVRTVLMKSWWRLRTFLIRLGVVIVPASVMVWTLSATGPSGWLGPEALRRPDILETSWMGALGHALERLFSPLGWDWRACTSLALGLLSRELIVSSMSILYGAPEEALLEPISRSFTHVTAFSYMTFVLLGTTCVPTLVTVAGELGLRYAVLVALYQPALGYAAALLITYVGHALSALV